jgi:hypothetical protein
MRSASARQRPGDAPRDDNAEQPDRHLQGQADEKRRGGQEPRQLAGVDEALDVLLADEPKWGQEREQPTGPRRGASLLLREPDQADCRHDSDGLRDMSEVLVERRRIASYQPVGNRVRGEDPRRSHRGDEHPAEQPLSHRRA